MAGRWRAWRTKAHAVSRRRAKIHAIARDRTRRAGKAMRPARPLKAWRLVLKLARRRAWRVAAERWRLEALWALEGVLPLLWGWDLVLLALWARPC
jgi:hypothetical protein